MPLNGDLSDGEVVVRKINGADPIPVTKTFSGTYQMISGGKKTFLKVKKMNMNLRKAQKHMQRAEELLNQNQFGFGVKRKRRYTGTEYPEAKEYVSRETRPRNRDEEYQFLLKVSEYVEDGSYRELQKILNKQTFHHGQALDKINKMNFERLTLYEAKRKMMQAIYPMLNQQYIQHDYFALDVPSLNYLVQDDGVPLEEFELTLINYRGRLLVYTAIDNALRSKLNQYEKEQDMQNEIEKMIAAGGVPEHVAMKYRREIEEDGLD